MTEKQRLLELPDEIRESELRVIEQIYELSTDKTMLYRMESKIKAAIADEVNDAGKAIYSNAEKRGSELVQRLNEDSLYIELKDNLNTDERKLDESKINTRFLRDLQSNLKVVYSNDSELVLNS